MASLILENLPPGAAAVLCDNLRLDLQNGRKLPRAVRSVIVPASGVVQITGLPDSNYSLLFAGAANAKHSRFSIDVGDRSKFPGFTPSSPDASGSVSDEEVREGARRALIALNEYGLVQRNVPVAMVAANVPGINSSGLLVPNQVQSSGDTPETMYHTGNKPQIVDVDGLQQALDDRVTDLELDDAVAAKVDDYLAGKEITTEDLSDQLDGSTTTYSLSKPFVTLRVLLNGLQQQEGSGNDFTVEPSPPNQAITFSRPLRSYNSLIVEYTTS
jgi:hypothetical protein